MARHKNLLLVSGRSLVLAVQTLICVTCLCRYSRLLADDTEELRYIL